MKKKIIIGCIVAAAVAIGLIIFIPKGGGPSDVKWITTTVSKQHIVQSITATGTIEPVTQVDVGTQVSGILTTLYVDYNSVVKKGQIIAELDKSTLLLDRNSSKNSVDVAQSKYTYELSNYTRSEALYKKGLIADSEYELALYNYETAKNDLEIAKNTLERAETNLGYATIYSPIDGVVLSKSVEVGQTVASSFSTPTLFNVAADLKDMQVIVDVDEADIGSVKDGQRAKFTVDAFPLDVFEGNVTQVRQEATVESNVVTYEVVISAANPDLKLKPGLTANVEIFTLDVECDATVSASALTFTPPVPKDAPERPADAPERPTDAPDGAPNGEMGENMGTLWVLNNNKIEPRRVTTGVTNGILTEVEGVDVNTVVVTGMETQAPVGAGAPPSGETSPFMPKRPGQK